MDVTYFVDAVDDEFLCGICQDVLLEPVSCAEGHLFCYECIEKWSREQGDFGPVECPQDRMVLPCVRDLTKARPMANLINKLTVRCVHWKPDLTRPGASSSESTDKAGGKRKRAEDEEEGGCGWTGRLRDRERHLLKECARERVHCPNAGCVSKVERRRAGLHAEECAYRARKCEWCAAEHPRNDRHRHDAVCPKKLLHCPRGCAIMVPRADLDSAHPKVCEMEPVECPFAKHGCRDASLPRKDYAAHQVDAAVSHAELLAAKVTKQQRRISSLEARAGMECFPFRWTVGDLLGEFSHGSLTSPRIFALGFFYFELQDIDNSVRVAVSREQSHFCALVTLRLRLHGNVFITRDFKLLNGEKESEFEHLASSGELYDDGWYDISFRGDIYVSRECEQVYS